MSERQKVTNLLRYVAVAVMIPTISIGGVLFLQDPAAHAMHMVGFLILGAAAVLFFLAAPTLAERWVPMDS